MLPSKVTPEGSVPMLENVPRGLPVVWVNLVGPPGSPTRYVAAAGPLIFGASCTTRVSVVVSEPASLVALTVTA